jgi:hypothetical protein
MSRPAAQTVEARLRRWLNSQMRGTDVAAIQREMRFVEPNIQREPSIGEVLEHVLIGGVRVRHDATVKPRRAHLRKTRTLTRKAARRPRRGGGH